ncbi:hypothetical protein AHAS_Ahas07G0100000 [Arachis hypogaea]
MKDINPNFFYAVNLDDEYKFQSAVWVDARCRASYEYYGDVVSLDSTYNTNKYGVVTMGHGLSFASFVGVNYHGKSTVLGCALLGNEEIPSYEWVFRQWVKCMGAAPQRIITDQCKSIFRAIKNVLLDTRHRWCIDTLRRSYCTSLETSLMIDEQRELEDDAADSRRVIPCATTSPMERQFQQEYTACMFRDVQIEFVKKANCSVSVVAEEGPVVCMKVEEEKLVNDNILCVPYDVHFDRSTQEVRCECNLFESSGVLCCHCLEVFHSYKVYKAPNRYVLLRWSKNIKRKHTYVKSSHDVHRSDESHVAFRRLCAHFYNIAQDFVNEDEETALFHAVLEETRAKLTAHRAKKRSESVADSHNNISSTSSTVAAVMDIQAPSKVNTKGRPKSKRLSVALDKSFKKSARRKNKHDPPVVCPESTQDVKFGGVVGRADPEQVGGFILVEEAGFMG